MDVELVVDGNVIDLNRIPLPADTLVIDKRWSLTRRKTRRANDLPPVLTLPVLGARTGNKATFL